MAAACSCGIGPTDGGNEAQPDAARRDVAEQVAAPTDDAQRLAGPARIIDGDSISVDGESVRLIGIDACEMNQVAEAPEGPWRCGLSARARVIELTEGHEVTCRWSERDIYDRLLARCEADGRDIGAQLVTEGLAVVYRHEGRPTAPELVPLEETARREGRGLWGSTFEDPKDYRRRNRR